MRSSAPGLGAETTSTEDPAAQIRLASLKRQVSTMKEKVGAMKGVLEEIKRQNPGAVGAMKGKVGTMKGVVEEIKRQNLGAVGAPPSR